MNSLGGVKKDMPSNDPVIEVLDREIAQRERDLLEKKTQLSKLEAEILELQREIDSFKRVRDLTVSEKKNQAIEQVDVDTEKTSTDAAETEAELHIRETEPPEPKPTWREVTKSTDTIAGTKVDHPTREGQQSLAHVSEPRNGATTSKEVEVFTTNEQADDEENKDKRNPKDMLLPRYKGQTLGDIAEKILNSVKQPLDVDSITKVIFDVQNDDEYFRARNSLATELRRGAREGRWKKIGRGSFLAMGVEAPTELLNSEEFKSFSS